MLDEKEVAQAVEKERLVGDILRSELRESRGKNCIHRICYASHPQRERLGNGKALSPSD